LKGSVELKRLHGPGAAAQGLLRSRLNRDDARAILGNIVMGDDDAANGAEEDEDDPLALAHGFERALDAAMMDFEPDEAAQGKLWREALKWANHAFFGGRIELLKQGVTTEALFSYDISSAYPGIIARLPSMKGGRWRVVKNPTREEIEQASMLSMFKIVTNFASGRPFYLLPFPMGRSCTRLRRAAFTRANTRSACSSGVRKCPSARTMRPSKFW
jgi:hypothetical protein